MLELVERATSASVFRTSGSNVRRDFAGRLTHARFRVRMMDDTGRSELKPACRAEAMILRCHRARPRFNFTSWNRPLCYSGALAGRGPLLVMRSLSRPQLIGTVRHGLA